jgi:hypothetical protein
MKKLICLSLALAMAGSVAGCYSPQQQNAAGGAVLGGLTGAVVGSAIDHGHVGGAGTIIGGVTGAAAGAMIGSAVTPQDPGYAPPPRRCAEFDYDYYGNRVCRAYY